MTVATTLVDADVMLSAKTASAQQNATACTMKYATVAILRDIFLSFQEKRLSLKARTLSPFSKLRAKANIYITLERKSQYFSQENAAKHSHTPHGKGKIYHDFAPQSVRPVEIIVILPFIRQKVLA